MSTHSYSCSVCGGEFTCNDDCYALTVGAGCHGSGPKVAFCSVECFQELKRLMANRWAICERIAKEGGEFTPKFAAHFLK